MSRRPRPPKYQLHKGSGQAKVRIGGKDIYLGVWGTPESKERYDRILSDWLAGQVRRDTPAAAQQPGLSVNDVLASYLAWALTYYTKGGSPTGQVDRIRRAFRVVAAQAGESAAVAFGPRSLKAARTAMVRKGWSRSFVNSCVGCVVRAWGWAVSEELVPGQAAHALREVVPLRRGEEGVREGRTVGPVPWAAVERVLPLLRPAVRDLLTTQYLAGMRPMEACHLRPVDIHQDGQVPGGPQFPGVWVYVVPPEANKNAHAGKQRVVFLGPKAQEILLPYLERRRPDEYLFSPAESERQRHAQRFAARKRRRFPSDERQVLRRRRAKPKVTPRERYDTRALQLAIRRACKKAGVELWVPNQLRHSRASEINAVATIADAQGVLGHSSPATTLRYAKTSEEAKRLAEAAAVMRDVG